MAGAASPAVGSGGQISQAGEQRSARIESLRALAALGVVVSHIYGATFAFGATVYASFSHRALLGGGDGVWLFFVLSGYLLFWPFAKAAYGGGGELDLGRYTRNRALRILPLYYVVLIVFLLVQEHGGTLSQWWRFGLFLENFSASTLEKVDGPMWSLVVELQFYVLLPLLAWVVQRLSGRSLRRAAFFLAAIGVLSLALRINRVELPAQPHRLWEFSLPGTLFFFVAGMLLALARLGWERRPPRWARGPLRRADWWLAASVPIWALAFWRYSLHPAVAVAAMLMVGACVLPLRAGGLTRVLEWRPLALLGVASYSLYLWHMPIVLHLADVRPFRGHLLLSLVLEVPCLVLLAALSYRLVEHPFLRLRRRWSAVAASSGPRRVPAGAAELTSA